MLRKLKILLPLPLRRLIKGALKEAYTKKRYQIELHKSVYVDKFNIWENSVRLSVFLSSGVDNLSFKTIDGSSITPEDVTSIETNAGIRTYFVIRFDKNLSDIHILYKKVRVKILGQIHKPPLGVLTHSKCVFGKYSDPKQIKTLTPEAQMLRKFINNSKGGAEYKNAWIFADRRGKADDNAEHLYRYIKSQRQNHNCWFVISEHSSDWDRLKAQGFNLIDYGSANHLKALADARFVISSQATLDLRYPVAKKIIDDFVRADFIFLQHGVINTDCSRWINQHNYRLFVTTTPDEYSAITDPKSSYNLTKGTVALTGMPRHDSLFYQKDKYVKNIISVMPTWRSYLAVRDKEVGAFKASSKLNSSEYYKRWSDFISSDYIANLCAENDYKVAFVPHPIFRGEFSKASFGAHVYVADEDISYQDTILRSAMCITDYSSVAYDMAAVGVPVLHYAFEEPEILNNQHTSKVDLDLLRENGLGPVVVELDELIEEIRKIVDSNGPAVVYSQRCAHSFKLFDGMACARIYKMLCDISQGGSR